MPKPEAIKALESHADAFLQGGLWSYTGYFPNDSYGKMGEDYYRWSKRAFDLIKALKE